MIPSGTGYAVWTGIDAAGTAVAGMILFGESCAVIRIASIVVNMAGIFGLNCARNEGGTVDRKERREGSSCTKSGR